MFAGMCFTEVIVDRISTTYISHPCSVKVELGKRLFHAMIWNTTHWTMQPRSKSNL